MGVAEPYDYQNNSVRVCKMLNVYLELIKSFFSL